MNTYQTRSPRESDQEFYVSNELRRGRQAATDLLGLIRQKKQLSIANADSLHHQAFFDLVTRVTDSFSNSLSILSSQDPATTRGPRASISKSSSVSSGREMCHKPRKGGSWTQVTSDLSADGYAWRKYGQKLILNANHPRSYFRCNNKPHCKALKKVQKMDDKPKMYRITHTGHHTCENPSSSPSFSDMGSSVFFNFQKEGNEQSDKLGRSATLYSPFTEVKESEDIEISKNDLWSLDDYDYIIGYVEFNDIHAF